MRSILLTCVILLVAYIIKIDLTKGTLSHAALTISEQQCVQDHLYETLTVQIHEGDTLQSLFTIHPSPTNISFLERLALFYKVNPHLKRQALIPGDIVKLPIVQNETNYCSK